MDATELITANPDTAFDRILARGYRMTYSLQAATTSIREFCVKVLDGEKVVGEADFTDCGWDAEALPQNVRVEALYRRQGIATAIYVLAEIVFGKTLQNQWKGGEEGRGNSEDAKALWNQPNRPFGNGRQ